MNDSEPQTDQQQSSSTPSPSPAGPASGLDLSSKELLSASEFLSTLDCVTGTGSHSWDAVVPRTDARCRKCGKYLGAYIVQVQIGMGVDIGLKDEVWH